MRRQMGRFDGLSKNPESGDENRETRGRKIVETDSVAHQLGESRQFSNCFISRLFACVAVSHSLFCLNAEMEGRLWIEGCYFEAGFGG